MKTQEAPLINRVAESGLITLELEKFYPPGEWVEINLSNYLFKGLILKEREFRAQLAETDWELYSDKNVFVHCATDAIVPPWAWMLLSKNLIGKARSIGFGPRESVVEKLMIQNMEQNLNHEQYSNERILIKGCSSRRIPVGVYMYVTQKLMPVVKSLMYGEACSNVPVYKQSVRRK